MGVWAGLSLLCVCVGSSELLHFCSSFVTHLSWGLIFLTLLLQKIKIRVDNLKEYHNIQEPMRYIYISLFIVLLQLHKSFESITVCKFCGKHKGKY